MPLEGVIWLLGSIVTSQYTVSPRKLAEMTVVPGDLIDIYPGEYTTATELSLEVQSAKFV